MSQISPEMRAAISDAAENWANGEEPETQELTDWMMEAILPAYQHDLAAARREALEELHDKLEAVHGDNLYGIGIDYARKIIKFLLDAERSRV